MIGKNDKIFFFVVIELYHLGIANSLDLTDRLLPRLQLKPEHKPYLLRFSPYNREQMLTIVNDR
jgi:cell division control protein 6